MKEPGHEERDVRALGIEWLLDGREFRPSLARRRRSVGFHDEFEHRRAHGKLIENPPHSTPVEGVLGFERCSLGAQAAMLEFLATAAGAGIIATRFHRLAIEGAMDAPSDPLEVASVKSETQDCSTVEARLPGPRATP